MTLLELLVQELPKRGGWPDGYDSISTNGYGAVWAYKTETAGLTAGRELYFHSSIEGRVTREQYETALAASQRVEWDGAGLPPVGCEFEHSFHAGGFSSWHWRKCTALGKHGVLCVDKNDVELYLNDTNNKFRPIHSEEDKNRDVAVAAMLSVFGSNAATGTTAALKAIYDAIAAGKIPGVRIK